MNAPARGRTRRTAYSHGQQEYSLPAGVPATPTQLAGGCWYAKLSKPPSPLNSGGPPHDTAYSFGAHIFVQVAGPEIESHPWQLVGSSEMQSIVNPPGEDAPRPPSQLTPEGYLHST